MSENGGALLPWCVGTQCDGREEAQNKKPKKKEKEKKKTTQQTKKGRLLCADRP
jgi:hypothetical protein